LRHGVATRAGGTDRDAAVAGEGVFLSGELRTAARGRRKPL